MPFGNERSQVRPEAGEPKHTSKGNSKSRVNVQRPPAGLYESNSPVSSPLVGESLVYQTKPGFAVGSSPAKSQSTRGLDIHIEEDVTRQAQLDKSTHWTCETCDRYCYPTVPSRSATTGKDVTTTGTTEIPVKGHETCETHDKYCFPSHRLESSSTANETSDLGTAVPLKPTCSRWTCESHDRFCYPTLTGSSHKL